MNPSRIVIIAGLLLTVPAYGWTQGGGRAHCCRGQGACRGPGRGMSMGSDLPDDQAVFHFLLDSRNQIRRTVTELPDGVETVTESDVPEIAAKIGEHVRSMYQRLEDGRPIHQRDPLFAEIFSYADKIEVTIEETEDGLRVRETSQDPYVQKLIKSHAELVSQFLANGYSEVHKDHPPPERE